MEIIRGHRCSISMCVCVCACFCVCVCISLSACASAKTRMHQTDVHVWALVTLRHMHASTVYMHLHNLCLQALRENSVPKFQPLLMVLELFNRKPNESWLGGYSCSHNSSLMLAPCHSYLLTPSAPLGADRLIGSYCSTSESEEGKLWPLPCSLASLFHFTPCFS